MTLARIPPSPPLSLSKPASRRTRSSSCRAPIPALLYWGSTPDGSDYVRDAVIVSTLRIARIRLINERRQVIYHSGASFQEIHAMQMGLEAGIGTKVIEFGIHF